MSEGFEKSSSGWHLCKGDFILYYFKYDAIPNILREIPTPTAFETRNTGVTLEVENEDGTYDTIGSDFDPFAEKFYVPPPIPKRTGE